MSRRLAAAAAATLLLSAVPEPAGAEYIGREPGRLTGLVAPVGAGPEELGEALAELRFRLAWDPRPELWRRQGEILAARGDWEGAEAAFRRGLEDPGARLGLAVALFHLGRLAEAREALGEPAPGEEPARAYARALLRLQGEEGLELAPVREELAAVLAADPFFAGAFDVWLGLNPEGEELEAHRERLAGRGEAEARWQRGEVLLRRGDPAAALAAVDGLAGETPGLGGRIGRLRARALFESGRDAAGQET